MLVAARDAKVKRFVYAASSSTYGDSVGLPKVEHVIGRPLSPYAVTKYVNELYADVFARTYGLPIIGLRYFNVFGPAQDPNGPYAAVIPKFLAAFRAGEAPHINGDGTVSRDFTFVANAVQANIRAMVTQQPEALNQVYNVALGDRTSLNELANTLQQLTEAPHPATHGPDRLGDIAHSQADISKAKTLLGYEPLVDVAMGLRILVGV
jgi:UDP-N-acetylglucosamine 4-epimerase